MRIYLILIAVSVLFLESCTKRAYISEEVIYSVDGNNENVINSDVEIASENDLINSVIDYAHTLEGTPYKWGGTTSSGFDCSGFVQHVFAKNGVDIPRMPADMIAMSKKIDKKDIQAGDLVYFKGSNINSSKIGHVALVISIFGNDFKMIHATSKGVIVNSFSQYDYWKIRYLFATRFEKSVLLGD